jgi:hypothetical protein
LYLKKISSNSQYLSTIYKKLNIWISYYFYYCSIQCKITISISYMWLFIYLYNFFFILFYVEKIILYIRYIARNLVINNNGQNTLLIYIIRTGYVHECIPVKNCKKYKKVKKMKVHLKFIRKISTIYMALYAFHSKQKRIVYIKGNKQDKKYTCCINKILKCNIKK